MTTKELCKELQSFTDLHGEIPVYVEMVDGFGHRSEKPVLRVNHVATCGLRGVQGWFLVLYTRDERESIAPEHRRSEDMIRVDRILDRLEDRIGRSKAPIHAGAEVPDLSLMLEDIDEPRRPAVELFWFANGVVAAFDRLGEQVPEVQGPLTELCVAGKPTSECVDEMSRRGWIKEHAISHR